MQLLASFLTTETVGQRSEVKTLFEFILRGKNAVRIYFVLHHLVQARARGVVQEMACHCSKFDECFMQKLVQGLCASRTK